MNYRILFCSGGTNIRKFKGSFVQQSFDCGHAHFEYGQGQIALPVGGHVTNFSQGCFSQCKMACASDVRQQLCQYMYFSLCCVEVHFKGQQFSQRYLHCAKRYWPIVEVQVTSGTTSSVVIHENATTKTNNSLLSTRLRRCVRTHRQKSSVNFLFD